MSRNAKRAKHPHHLEAMRREITSLAARLMAEDGISNYGLAKRKAAKQLGAPDSEALPTNQEIEEALRDYLTIFQPDELRDRLRLLRQEALKIMRRLEQFKPYLTGPVLDGVAGRYTEAEIVAFADSAKDVEIFLLDQGIGFEYADIPRKGAAHGADPVEARLRLEGDDATLLLSIYPYAEERMHRRNPHTGQVAARAGIDAVAALLVPESVAGVLAPASESGVLVPASESGVLAPASDSGVLVPASDSRVPLPEPGLGAQDPP